MTKKHVSLLVVFVLLFTTLFSSFAFAADEEWVVADEITIKANFHVQTHGDKTAEDKGAITFGTSGEAKRLENFSLTLVGAPADMEIRYGVHAQTHGDLPKDALAKSPAVAGTAGEAKRVEGVKIGLYKKGTDDLFPGYQVSYQVHMQGYGWGADAANNWFKGNEDAYVTNGTFAGTRGEYRRVEAVSLVIEKIAKLSVVDVTADNLKQVVVEFNQKVVDNEEVEDAGNYALENDKGKAVKGKNGLNVDIIDVEINGNTAVLTFDNAVENQTDAVLVINKNVVGEELEFEVDFNDLDVPTVEDADVIGENMIKVIFSEPIDTATVLAKEFKVLSEDGKTDYRVRNVTTAKNGTEALVEVRTDFEDGDEIVLTVNNGIKDYAGFRVAKTSIDLTVVEDNSEIEVVDFRQAKEDGIILIFNKNITVKDNDKSNFYHTNSKNTVDKDGAKADGNELTLSFTENELPTGTATIFIDGDSLGDYWGNTNEKTIRFEARISDDTVVPTIKKITVVDGRNLTVDFDKSMDKDSAQDEDNYSIVFESNGKEVKDTKIYRATLTDKDTVQIRLSGDALAPGKYLLRVDGVEDIRGNAIKAAEKSFKIEGTALTDGDITVKVYQNSAVEYLIQVNFGRKMDLEDARYSVDLLENYSLYLNGKLTTLASLADNDDYYVDLDVSDDEKVVEITIQADDAAAEAKLDAFNSGNDNLYISRVKDGLGLLSASATHIKQLVVETVLNVTVSEVNATALDTIEVKLSGKIDYFEEEDIQLATTATTPTASQIADIIDDVTLSDDGKKITIKLDVDLNSEAKYVTTTANALYLVAKTGESETRFGGNLVITAKPVVDKIAPEFDSDYSVGLFEDGYKVNKTSGTAVSVELKFTEAIEINNIASVMGSLTLSDIARTEYSIAVSSADNTVLVITFGSSYVAEDETTVELVTVNEDFVGLDGNKVKAFKVPVILN